MSSLGSPIEEIELPRLPTPAPEVAALFRYKVVFRAVNSKKDVLMSDNRVYEHEALGTFEFRAWLSSIQEEEGGLGKGGIEGSTRCYGHCRGLAVAQRVQQSTKTNGDIRKVENTLIEWSEQGRQDLTMELYCQFSKAAPLPSPASTLAPLSSSSRARQTATEL